MPALDPTRPAPTFFLIVADHDLRVFCVEGPMTADAPWQAAARRAQEHRHRVECGPRGSDRAALVEGFLRRHQLVEVPAGTIVRPMR